MRFLNRFRDDSEVEERNTSPQIPGDGHGGNLSELRAAAEQLLAAGADAINRTLSSDSEAYLAASRQEGGE